MNENDRYIPPSQGGPGLSEERPPQLGKISLLTVIVTLLVTGLAMQFRQEKGPSLVRDVLTAAGVFSGMIMAIVALATRRGRPGVLVPALSTLVIAGLLIWLGVTNFMRARERSLQARERGNQPPTIRAEASRELIPNPEGKPLSPAAQRVKILEEIREATKPCLDELRAASAECVEANRALREAGEFSPAALTTKELIEKRRAMLLRIVNASEQWDNLHVTAEGKLTEALRRPTIPPADAQRFLEAWRRDRAELLPLLTRLRMAERNSSRALIGLLSILEHDLGQWELSPDKKGVVFKRAEAGMEYRVFSGDASAAAREQDQLLRQIASRQSRKAPEAPAVAPATPSAPAPSTAAAPAATAAPAGGVNPASGGREKWVGEIAKATGAEGEVFRVAKPYLDALYDQNEACAVASLNLHHAGALNPRLLGTKAAIAERRALVQRVIATAEQWEATAFNADQTLPTAVNRPGVPADQVQKFLSRWKDARYQVLLLIKRERASERLSARAMLGILALLERELGNWEASPDGKQVNFKRPGASDELRKLMQEFTTQNKLRMEVGVQVRTFSPAK